MKKEVTAGVRICSSPEMVQELLKIGLIKVLLISEDVPYEKRQQIFTGKRIILTRQHCVDLGEEETDRVRITEMEESLEYIHRFTELERQRFH